MRKGGREIRCLSAYTVVGLHLPLMHGDERLRTTLCRETASAGTLLRVAAALKSSGWIEAGE
jgi:hypothetical protein